MADSTIATLKPGKGRATRPMGAGLGAPPWRYEFWRALFGAPYRVLETPPVFDVDQTFPAGRRLIEHFDAVQKECLALALDGAAPTFDEISPRQRNFFEHDKRQWRMALLRVYGANISENVDRTPFLKRFFAEHPEVLTAVISVFEPRKHVAPHDGPFRGILRFHLGLLVEEYEDGTTAGKLVVDGVTYYVRERQAMLWDDTYVHEAYNTSDKPRVALLLDVFRPGMPWWLALYTRGVVWLVRQAMVLNGSRRRMAVR